MTRVGLVDYGMGNLQSVRNAFEYLGAQVTLIQSPEHAQAVSHVVLPGVGSFAEGMRHLEGQGLAPALRAIRGKKPFLGICLGMQLMADEGEEGGKTNGLGLIAGRVRRLKDNGMRIPHVGWNDIQTLKSNALLDLEPSLDYYFVHSYCFDATNDTNILSVCRYSEDFTCVVGDDAAKMYGVQFHPEKSHAPGLDLLKRFLSLSC